LNSAADRPVSGGGIGVGHTRARLERLYGSRASFQLTGGPGVVASDDLAVAHVSAAPSLRHAEK